MPDLFRKTLDVITLLFLTASIVGKQYLIATYQYFLYTIHTAQLADLSLQPILYQFLRIDTCTSMF